MAATNAGNEAAMPKDQLEYFMGKSSAKAPSDVKTLGFVNSTELSCPHEANRTASRLRNSPNQPALGDGARPHVLEKYRMFFSGNSTPMSRSTHVRDTASDSALPPQAAARSNAGIDCTATPQLGRTPQQQSQQPKETAAASGSRGGYAPPLQEPRKHPDAASAHSNASSASGRPAPSVQSKASAAQGSQHRNVSPVRSTADSVKSAAASSQRSAPQSYRPPSYKEPRSAEHPITQQPQYPPRQQYPPGRVDDDRASTSSTRMSEPQVVSVQPYDPRDRSMTGSERSACRSDKALQQQHEPRPEMHGAPSRNAYRAYERPQDYGMEEIPESTAGGAVDERQSCDDGFSSRGGSERVAPGGAYQQQQQQPPRSMRAAQAPANAPPPRSPRDSLVSHSTASVATASSRRRDPQGMQYEHPASNNGDNGRMSDDVPEDEAAYPFKPTINPRSRNLASRRPDYGQEAPGQLHDNADDAQAPQPPGSDTNGVFSRLYGDAKRYNKERDSRERQLERQRMRDRGEACDDDDEEEEERSPGTAPLSRRSRSSRREKERSGDREDEGEDDDATTRGDSIRRQKRPIDPEVFERLSKPTNVVRKYVQVKEQEEQQRQEAALQAQKARMQEMNKVATYTWAVPASSFKIEDLRRQNTLFVA